MIRQRLAAVVLLCVELCALSPLLFSVDGFALAAPLPNFWSPPQRIPGYENVTSPPYLIADQNKTVHVFGSQDLGGEVAIIYSQWRLDRGWSAPVDVLLSPRSQQAL